MSKHICHQKDFIQETNSCHNKEFLWQNIYLFEIKALCIKRSTLIGR